jgi:pimeloyl-ACP methyl ester carboxylesterase
VDIHARLALPSGPTQGVLVLCHGLTTDRDEHGAFVELRDRALDVGLAVARFDFRAHGESGGNNEELSLAGERADVEAVAAMVESELGPRVPMIPLGVSFGGAAAVHLASVAESCAGLVLWYAVTDYEWNYGVDSPVAFTAMMRSAADPERDPPWSGMPVVGTSYYFPRALLEELPGDATFSNLELFGKPVLAYFGSRDSLVGVRPLQALAARHPSVEVRIVPGAGHGFLLWRPWVVRQTVRWCAKAVARFRP